MHVLWFTQSPNLKGHISKSPQDIQRQVSGRFSQPQARFIHTANISIQQIMVQIVDERNYI
jgi:hypothetical protein